MSKQENNRRYYDKNKEAINAKRKQWREERPGYDAYRLRKQNYGVTEIQFNTLMLIQCGKCAICSGMLTLPCLDHDHLTGKVRGLLCDSCNKGIGFLKDSTDLLAVSIEYLQGA